MAYDYEKSKALYEKLDPDKQKAFMEQNKNDANVQRFAKEYAAEKSSKTTSTNTASSTPTQTSTSTYSSSTVKPEYQGTGTNKSNTYSNQGEGTYSYNPTSGYYEKQGTTQNDNYSKIRNEWNNLTYAQQQEKLKQNPNLKAGVEKVGGTFKTEETTPTTGTTGTKTETTPKQGEWDYQDDSPERMAQIAQNLLEYKQTMPYLFDDKNAFDNFFINGKGRSAAQIRFLNDYFEANKKYGKYDTYTPEQAGYGIAYGDIPENYLTMLKATDPQRYQEVLRARQDAEDKIKNKSNLNSLISEAGIEDSDVTKWLKKEGFLVDENGDKVDDRLYVAPTEEEQKKVDRRNEILARKQEIKNMERNLLEDLTKQYPGVPRATLMGIVNDRMSDLQREYEDLSCEEAQLTGAIEYDQNERKAQMEAGQQTINNLQKEYGMYYQYTPEGMSQLAQAQYAATNVTLDQAENGTDTQKQMALEQTLTPIYEQYGSIIERPMVQVINDVMSYAKQKGISLSQALKENFTDKLKSKEAYQAIQGQLTEPNLQIIGYNSDGKAVYGYWDSATKTFKQVSTSGGTIGGEAIGTATTGYGVSYNVISQTDLSNGINNFLDKYKQGDDGGWCGAFVNEGLKEAGVADSNIYDDSLDSKLKSKNEEADATAQAGWVAIWKPEALKTEEGKEHGHVGFVVEDNGDGTVVIKDSNGTPDKNGKYNKTVGTHTVRKSQLYGYFNPSKGATTTTTGYSDAFTKAGDIIATGINGVENKKMFRETLQGLLDEGDYTGAFEYITITGKNNADNDLRDKITAAETAMTDLISIRDALDAYYAAGGDTGILQGSLESVANSLGKTTDPKLVGLATKISEAIQAYRKNISGTAFSEKEAEEYEALFPTIKAGQEYNNAKLTSTLDSMVIRLNQLYGGLIGPRTYSNVLDAHEQATGNKYSMYEEQSQLYNYLLTHGYLNPNGTVKTANDFASYWQNYQTQRLGKRF